MGERPGNRALACERARVEPRFRTYDGDDLIPFVVSLNLHRRHLSESQRAMVAGQIANMENGTNRYTDKVGGEISPPKISTDQAAELLNVSRSSVVNARTVMQQGTPEEIEAAKAGAVAVGTLAKDIRKGVPPAERGLNRPKAEPVRGPRVIPPAGETLEAMFRRGIAMMREGRTAAEVAKALGVSGGVWSMGHDVVELTSRTDLSARDKAAVAAACDEMNRTGQVARAARGRGPAITSRGRRRQSCAAA